MHFITVPGAGDRPHGFAPVYMQLVDIRPVFLFCIYLFKKDTYSERCGVYASTCHVHISTILITWLLNERLQVIQRNGGAVKTTSKLGSNMEFWRDWFLNIVNCVAVLFCSRCKCTSIRRVLYIGYISSEIKYIRLMTSVMSDACDSLSSCTIDSLPRIYIYIYIYTYI